jgi:ABC-type glycerol-3-phosphate transport system substrate-binding protein
MFKSGKAAMLFQGTWTEGTMLEAGEEFFKNVSVEAWPSMVGNDNDKIFLASCSDGLWVTTAATEDKKAAAIKFVKYLASEQASKYAVELSSQIPIRKGLNIGELNASSLLAKTIDQINNNPWTYRNVQSNYATTTAYADILRSKLGNGLLMKIYTPEQFAEQIDKLMKEATKQ